MKYLETEVPFTNAFLTAAEEGVLDNESLIAELILFMGESKVAEFARVYEYNVFFESMDNDESE